MKRLQPIYLLIIVFLLSNGLNTLRAQTLSSYTFSYVSGSYNEFSGTVIVSGDAAFGDDVYTNIPIGFPFVFEGQVYTTIGVSTNGFIWFGTGTAGTAEYDPISDASNNLGGSGIINGVVSAFGDHLVADTSTLVGGVGSDATGPPLIQYQTTSNGCTSEFTLEYRGMVYYGSKGGQSLGFDRNRLDLQIHLYQGTNVISVQPFADDFGYSAKPVGQMGLRGASNADYANRSIPSGTGWNASAAGGTNAATVEMNPKYPANGATYVWTPTACPLTVSSTPFTDPGCTVGGTITINASGGSPLTYIINNGTTADTNTTGTFSNLSAGVYSILVSNTTCGAASCTTDTLVSSVPTPTASNSGPVCAGGTLTLSTPTVSGATYSWTGPNNFSSAQQNPVIDNVTAADSGVYTVVDTIGGCVSGAATTDVVINGATAAPKVGSNSPVCAGATLLLSDSTSGATYSWTGPNTYTSTSQNPTITNVAVIDSGTYTVINTVSGCASAPATIHVVINPAPPTPKVGNNSPLCLGTTLILTDSTTATSYSWTGPNSFSSGLQDPTRSGVVAADSGTYTIVDTVAGCASTPATTHVSINGTAAAPKVGSNSPICAGATLLLRDSTNGATYSWTGPGSYASSAQNPAIANTVVADSGTYTVVDTVSGCVSLPATVHVVINPTPALPRVGSNSPVCVGSTLILTDTSNGATYSWTGPTSYASSQQNPIITNVVVADSGTYTVVDTIAGCTSAPASVHVVINPIPATPIIGSNSPICIGSTLNLTNSISGATYNWTGPNNFTSASQNPGRTNAVALDSGTYTVVDTVSGCASLPATTHVTINTQPVIDSVKANTPICQGATLDLTTNPVTATYKWTGPNGFTASIQDPARANVLVIDSGYYVLTDSVAGCPGATDSVKVVVVPGPPSVTAGNTGPVCAGQSFELTASTVAGVTYAWSGPGGFTSQQQDTTLLNSVAGESGTYTVTISNGGCGTSSDQTTVAVNPLPTLPNVGSNSPLCSGQNLDLTVVAQTGATYNWSGPGGYTSGTQNPIINAVAAADSGYYVVTVTVGSCGSTSDSVLVSIRPNIPVVAGNDGPVCAGQAVTISATKINGATYSWTGPGAFTSAQASDTILSTATGNSGKYTVTVTNGVCGASVDSTTVVVNPAPTTPQVSNNGPLCAGLNLGLTVITQAGATYSWSGPNGYSSVTQNPGINDVTSADSGYYVVTVTQGNCGSLYDSTLVIVNPTPPQVIASNDGPICTNQTLQLNVTAVANATYNWSGPNQFDSTSQSPTIANIGPSQSGIYYVTVTNSCGISTDSTIVSVITSAAAPILTSNSPLCIGNPINLYSNTEPGATYAWSGPNSFSATSQNTSVPNAQVSDSGVYTLSVTIPGCGTASATIDIVVNTGLPTPPIHSNSPICEGDTLTLSTSSYPGANISWTGPNFPGSTSQSTFVADVKSGNAGTYYLNVVSGGCTGIDSVIVVVNALPILKLPSTSYCNGDSAVLNAGGGFEIYHWSNGSSDSEIVVNAQDTSINSSLTITDFNGCTNTTTVTSVFLAKPDTIVVNQSGNTLTSSWSNAIFYQWYANGTLIDTAINNLLVMDSSGIYTVVVTDGNGCTAQSANVYFYLTGINTVSANGNMLLLYPNPASGNVFLSASVNIETYVIYDVQGQEMLRREGVRSPQAAIDLKGLAKGVYYLQATIGQEVITRPFAIIE